MYFNGCLIQINNTNTNSVMNKILEAIKRLENEVLNIRNEIKEMKEEIRKMNEKLDGVYELSARNTIKLSSSLVDSRVREINNFEDFMEFLKLISTENLIKFLINRNISLENIHKSNDTFWSFVNRGNQQIKKILRKISTAADERRNSQEEKSANVSRDMNKFLKNSRNLEINVAGRAGKSNGKISIRIGHKN